MYTINLEFPKRSMRSHLNEIVLIVKVPLLAGSLSLLA